LHLHRHFPFYYCQGWQRIAHQRQDFYFNTLQQPGGANERYNNVLLVAFYLFNAGYAVLQLAYWQPVTRLQTLVTTIADKTGILIFILAGAHYLNLLCLYLFSKRKRLFI